MRQRYLLGHWETSGEVVGLQSALEAASMKSLMPGARVAATGNPMRDPTQIRASFPSMDEIKNTKVLDLNRIRRTDGSWTWAQDAPPCNK